MCQLKDCGKNPLGLYRVQEGDTLQSVCARFALPPALVAARNGLRAFPPAGALLLLPMYAGRRIPSAREKRLPPSAKNSG